MPWRPGRFCCVLTLCALIALAPGCGSIFGLAFDRGVEIKSTPRGATVYVDGKVHEGGTTPTKIGVWSGADHVVKTVLVNEDGLEVTGQTTLTRGVRIGIVFLDIVFTGGLGVLIDWLTGAMYHFDRDAVLLNLGSHEAVAEALKASKDFPPVRDHPRTGDPNTPGVHGMGEDDPILDDNPVMDGPGDDDPIGGDPEVRQPLKGACEICDQPRGDVSPCPHCGMD